MRKYKIYQLSAQQLAAAPEGNWAFEVLHGIDSGQFTAAELAGWYWHIPSQPNYFGNACPCGPFSSAMAARVHALETLGGGL